MVSAREPRLDLQEGRSLVGTFSSATRNRKVMETTNTNQFLKCLKPGHGMHELSLNVLLDLLEHEPQLADNVARPFEPIALLDLF